MAKARPDGIGASIRSLTPPRRGGNDAWFQLVPPAVIQELEELHDDQLEGRVRGSPTWLARRISHELRARGISDVGYQGVLAWMKERQRAKPRA